MMTGVVGRPRRHVQAGVPKGGVSVGYTTGILQAYHR